MLLTAKIHIESYHAYNSGFLLGKEIDISDWSLDDLNEFYKEESDRVRESMGEDHDNGPIEEWFITDYEISIEDHQLKLPKGVLGPRPEDAIKLVDAIQTVRDYDVPRLIYLIEYENLDIETAMDKIEDIESYEGNLEDVAQELVFEGCFGDIPEAIADYIDYEAIARDLNHDGYTHVDEMNMTFKWV